ncbi:ABC transporter substrate-binding protein [Streptomyces sp. NPDC088910]|uniref:ABC transporter substrate-binding protein n=1 Tax=Streptomyces sp. NPDC088910 TaxID=3365911 RepID=UPI00382ED370
MSRQTRNAALLGCTAIAVSVALTACSAVTPSKSGGGDGGGDLTLRVQGMPPATDKAALTLFKQQVADFEKANPGIKVKGSTTVFDPLTFSAKLAGGNVEDVIKVPLTEPQRLIQQKQVQSISGQLQSWDHFKEFNPQVLKPLSDSAGQVYGVPQNPYAQGLVYNRALFKAAGLDPDKPPTTWDEVRADAKAIAAKTGRAGFVQESKDNQGGWQLAMLSYAFGGDLEQRQGDTYTATLTGEATKKALGLLKDMRWSDKSLGRNLLNNQNDVIKQFAAGQVGMFMGSPGTYRLAKTQFGMENTDDFGVASMPQSGGNATLTGGDIYMVPKSADTKHAAAAVKWLTFAYAEPQYSTEAAAGQAKALAADPKSAVGVPTLPVFDTARQTEINAAIKPYVNVKLDNFAPYTQGLGKLDLKPEPPYEAQTLYTALDPVVQAVLTDRGADVDALLAKAEKDVNAKLATDQSTQK